MPNANTRCRAMPKIGATSSVGYTSSGGSRPGHRGSARLKCRGDSSRVLADAARGRDVSAAPTAMDGGVRACAHYIKKRDASGASNRVTGARAAASRGRSTHSFPRKAPFEISERDATVSQEVSQSFVSANVFVAIEHLLFLRCSFLFSGKRLCANALRTALIFRTALITSLGRGLMACTISIFRQL
jgi:hypothetical protein